MVFMLTPGIRTTGGCSSGSGISQRVPNLQILGAHTELLQAYRDGAVFCDARCEFRATVGHQIEHSALLHNIGEIFNRGGNINRIPLSTVDYEQLQPLFEGK